MSDAAFLESVVVDKHGVQIHHGDHVKVHANHRHQPEGDVDKVVTTAEEAQEEGVKNPPKVIVDTDDNKRLKENPNKIEVLDERGNAKNASNIDNPSGVDDAPARGEISLSKA